MLTFCLLFGYVINSNAQVEIKPQSNTTIEKIALEEYAPVYYVENDKEINLSFSDLSFHPEHRLRFSKKL